MGNPEFVTNAQIAKIYGVSIHAVNLWAHERRLPPYVAGNVRRFSEVDAAVAKIREETRVNKGMFTKKEVFDIYKRRDVKGETLKQIAEATGRTVSGISRILRGDNYREYWQEFYNR